MKTWTGFALFVCGLVMIWFAMSVRIQNGSLLALILLWAIACALTLIFCILWKPIRRAIMGQTMAQNRPPNPPRNQKQPSASMPPYHDTTVDYWNVQKWSQSAIRKGLEHDFNWLGRRAVILHYRHSPSDDCTDECELRENPNLHPEEDGNDE